MPRSLLVLLAASAFAACTASAPAGGDAVVRAVPFAPGERLAYSLHDASGATLGRGTLAVRSGDGVGTLVLLQQYEEARPPAAAPPATDAITVTVDAATLQPRALERTTARRDARAQLTAAYAPDGATVTLARDGAKPRTLRLGPHAYDNESALWLWRTLPLADGYTQRYVSVSAADGAVALVTLAVTARQRIEVPAGAFDTWRLLVRGGRATGVAWVNVEAPHQVVQWDNGSVVFRLEAAP